MRRGVKRVVHTVSLLSLMSLILHFSGLITTNGHNLNAFSTVSKSLALIVWSCIYWLWPLPRDNLGTELKVIWESFVEDNFQFWRSIQLYSELMSLKLILTKKYLVRMQKLLSDLYSFKYTHLLHSCTSSTFIYYVEHKTLLLAFMTLSKFSWFLDHQ